MCSGHCTEQLLGRAPTFGYLEHVLAYQILSFFGGGLRLTIDECSLDRVVQVMVRGT
jgi:hypothetical protein